MHTVSVLWIIFSRCYFYLVIFKSSPEDIFIDLRERERERNIDWLLPIHIPTRDWTCNLGMCPDQRSNQQPFWCVGRCSNQRSHPARAQGFISSVLTYYLIYMGDNLFLALPCEPLPLCVYLPAYSTLKLLMARVA